MLKFFEICIPLWLSQSWLHQKVAHSSTSAPSPGSAFNVQVRILHSEVLIARSFSMHASKNAPQMSQLPSFVERLLLSFLDVWKRIRWISAWGTSQMFDIPFVWTFWRGYRLRSLLAKGWHPGATLQMSQVGLRTGNHHLKLESKSQADADQLMLGTEFSGASKRFQKIPNYSKRIQ